MPTQDQVRAMVDDHVLVPATNLISGLVGLTSRGEEIITMFDIFSKADYETPARENGLAVENRDGKFWVLDPEDFDDEMDMAANGPFDTEQAAWQSACEFSELEPHYDEAYEHWIISDWLACQLEKHGEIIEQDFYGLNIWGRCGTGQAIYLDGVMNQICSEMRRYVPA